MVDPITSGLGWLIGQTAGRMQHNITETGNPFFYAIKPTTKATTQITTKAVGMAKQKVIMIKRKGAKGKSRRVIIKKKPAGGKGISGLGAAGIGVGAFAAGYGTRIGQEILSGETMTIPDWIPVIGGMNISKAGATRGIAPITQQNPPPTVWNTAPPPPVYSPVINYEIATERTIEPIRSGIVSYAQQQGGYYADYPMF